MCKNLIFKIENLGFIEHKERQLLFLVESFNYLEVLNLNISVRAV